MAIKVNKYICETRYCFKEIEERFSFCGTCCNHFMFNKDLKIDSEVGLIYFAIGIEEKITQLNERVENVFLEKIYFCESCGTRVKDDYQKIAWNKVNDVLKKLWKDEEKQNGKN